MNQEQTKLLHNTATRIRLGALQGIYAASSGHPGGSLSIAEILAYLYFCEMHIDPAHPHDPNRDRFVLSSGHASALLYSLLHLTGYGLEMADLEQFRQWGSKTPGHPEYHHTVGVETTTGPLGQGIAHRRFTQLWRCAAISRLQTCRHCDRQTAICKAILT